ncbi:B12-binding domain-containing radical SAM protein [Dongia soli]|uniref:B12-binding domain-containing radical SAM protein n=1 Tax=Dongia soli TaxID=600628 RepID=A0ABU5E5R8_9PROT|nr:B12-binding domain-containing radical SAM protein [Dongia soli]MDY0881242.1 B12-binding domain-containing radical SAM protein [Dongia soli]
MKSPVQVRNARRVLCVFPRYTPSFGTFEYAYRLMGVRAFMPPQGILVIAGYLPEAWNILFIDENVHMATQRDFSWAEIVLVSGMHVQSDAIHDIARRARAAGRCSVLGGPSASACPEKYPDFDYLHLGEIGDATDALIERLDADAAPPPAQQIIATRERLPLTDFPIPAYHLIERGSYMLGSVQFSSGCPYRCEFCDIPALYGRQPRLKKPQQVLAELDAMIVRGPFGCIYFVDDNFIANRKAVRELLPHLVAWQKERGYPVHFACEATLNIAKLPDLLALMREAYFHTVFCGIETPELGALKAIAKQQNLTVPMLEGIEILNSYGLEVVSGIILGLDTDTVETAGRVNDFVDRSQIPVLTINLLQALPRTPLWDRLAAAGRLVDDTARESNVAFTLPYQDVVGSWLQCVRHAYRPEAVYARFAHNVRHTFPNRIKPPVTAARLNAANIRKALTCLSNIFLHVGLLGDYRRVFWGMAWPLLREGRIEDLIHIGLVAHHLITYARQCEAGRHTASNYASHGKQAA